ncbi:MAG: hypothetical protein P8I74_07690 [Phycisphaerales bacterium]|nr:hypothetical protein [Phycisphaerales bacterium]
MGSLLGSPRIAAGFLAIECVGHMVVLLLLLALFEPPPPLSDAVREVLVEVQDDRDAPDAGMLALLNHVQAWPKNAGSLGGRLHIEHDELVASPAAHRGVLMVVEGRLEQVEQLARPLERVQEWFVRPADGRPVMVYVPMQGMLAKPGDEVVLECYFYKRLRIEDRQGVSRTYPVFIGGQPRVVAMEEQAVDAALRDAKAYMTTMVSLIFAVVAVLFVVLGLLWLNRRSKRRTPHAGIFGDVDPEPPVPPLPDEPADAMDELSRRNSENE